MRNVWHVDVGLQLDENVLLIHGYGYDDPEGGAPQVHGQIVPVGSVNWGPSKRESVAEQFVADEQNYGVHSRVEKGPAAPFPRNIHEHEQDRVNYKRSAT